jgi:hypothetical protein
VPVEVIHPSSRYHNNLDRNITTSEWSPEEDELLFVLHDEVGNKWTLISSRLPGRYFFLTQS